MLKETAEPVEDALTDRLAVEIGVLFKPLDQELSELADLDQALGVAIPGNQA
ncbi:MAG: hypothetical protein HQ518_09305 [Rhodopirellula sp.]|nr:hypothetical protein [Rhodopirellula sp.]